MPGPCRRVRQTAREAGQSHFRLSQQARRLASPRSRRGDSAAGRRSPSKRGRSNRRRSAEVSVLRAEHRATTGKPRTAAAGPAWAGSRVRLVNELAEPTAIHWHGVRLVNAMDGAPPLTQARVAPGDSFDYRFVAPDAGTYWYHPPGCQPAGLCGVLVVDETEPVDVDHDKSLIFAAKPTRPRPGPGN